MSPPGAVLLLTSKPGSPTTIERQLVARLPSYGVTPVVASAEDDACLAEWRGDGVRAVHAPALKDPRTLGSLLRLPTTLWALRRLALRHDVGLIHSLRGSTTPAALVLSRLTGLPHVCHAQFLYASPVRYRKLWLHRARNLTAVSRAVLESFHRACPEASPVRTKVVYNGIDATEFCARASGIDARARAGIPVDAFVVGMVGSLDARKDPLTLLDAAEPLAADDLCLLFVGPFRDADYRRRTLAAAEARGLLGRSRFVGFQADPSPWIHALDLLVHPARSEAMGLVLLEAMAHAKPVVASRVGGIPEVVADGVSGLLVAPGDVAGFTRAMATLKADRGLRSAFGAAGRRRVETEFSVARALEAVVELYGELAGR